MEDKKALTVNDVKSELINDFNFDGEKKEPAKKPILESILKSLQQEADKNSNAKKTPLQKPKVEDVVAKARGQGLSEFSVREKNSAIVEEILKEENEKLKPQKPAKQEKVVESESKKAATDKGYKNSYIYGFIFIIGSILLEVFNFIRLDLGFLPTCFGIELSIILMLAGIIFFVPTETLKIIVMSLLLGVQVVINVINGSLYKTLNELLTADMMFALKGEAADAFEWSVVDWQSIGFACIVVLLVVLMIIFGNKYMPKFKIRKAKTAVVSLIILLMSIESLGFSSLKLTEAIYFANAEQAQMADNDQFLYNNTNIVKYASLKRFGFWGYYINSFSSYLNNAGLNEAEEEALTNFIKTGDNFKYTNSEYLGANVSGALADDNLIVIMMESVEWFAIDPVNTPNLYNFIEDYCVQFTNFYANNKTNISEQISFMGNMPFNKSYNTLVNSVGLDTPYSLPNLFRQEEYQSVNYFHDYKGTIYCRNVINKELGFENVYALEQCSLENKSKYFGDFVDDGDFINSLKTQFMPNNKKFFSYFTSVTTHGPYEKSNERYEEYYQRFDNNYQAFCDYVVGHNLDYNLPEQGTREYNILKEYKSKAMALDNAINVILNYLKTTRDASTNVPLYDNTTIVLFGDHNCYYSDLGYNIKGTQEHSNDKDIYNIPFVIFNKDLQAGKVDSFCNTYDIYPTICDLYGLSYNKSLTQGYSVFSSEIQNSLFVSAIAGVFDENYFTKTLDDYTPQNSSIETNAKLLAFKQKINDYLTKQEYIEKYYQINYSKNVG